MQRIGKIKRFCDWIFDVQLLTEEQETKNTTKIPYVVVGLAHNLVQIWDPNSNSIIKSVICTERCILYALAFHGRSLDSLIVASGTVFQQILLWDPSIDDIKATPSKSAPIQRLHSHDGVIFKLKWSEDGTRLASVSDDRTVQLWSNQYHQGDDKSNTKKQILNLPFTSSFRSWGHAARLWDVVFTANDQGLATTSEDGLCKVWNSQGECIATLQGHVGRHVWRVALKRDPKSQQEIIATGGGDGTVVCQ
jgi:WD40 repeat protein